jgi:hypothetical protein
VSSIAAEIPANLSSVCVLRKADPNETAMVPASRANLCCLQINVGYLVEMDGRSVLEKYTPIFAKSAFWKIGLNLAIRQCNFRFE